MAPHDTETNFRFAISLSVLNHLGRNLYRNFITVLGEAISNAWDADAKNVWINIDRENSIFSIKDDGTGMSSDDFQSKFLKIGYSKRSDGKLRHLVRDHILVQRALENWRYCHALEGYPFFPRHLVPTMLEVL